MHDPSTVVFEIHYPWYKRFWQTDKQYLLEKNSKYHTPFITIWHNDPETDGTDDSCGYSYPKVSKTLKEQVKKEAEFECREYGLFPNYKSKQDPLSIVLAVFQIIVWRLFKNDIKPKHLVEMIKVGTNPVDNLRHCAVTENKEDVERLFFLCLRSYLRIIRPWYNHPKWHIYHWSLQIHPLQKIKRYLFERCCVCGKGYKWGEQVMGCWDSNKKFHSGCDNSIKPNV
jgi:hypothetical protein